MTPCDRIEIEKGILMDAGLSGSRGSAEIITNGSESHIFEPFDLLGWNISDVDGETTDCFFKSVFFRPEAFLNKERGHFWRVAKSKTNPEVL